MHKAWAGLVAGMLFVASATLHAQEPTPAAPPAISLDDQLRAMLKALTVVEADETAVLPICTDPRADVPAKIYADGHCDDGDATLFNGLLCAAGINAGCRAVEKAQTDDGEWLRSPRYVTDRSKRPDNSFSPDMSMGVQAYAMAERNKPAVKAAFSKWLQWIEDNRPCVVGGEPNCPVRGWPRYCRDDTEKGCTLKPGDLMSLKQVSGVLGVAVPSFLKSLFDQAGGPEERGQLLYVNANVNDLGFSLHLVGVGVWLAKLQGDNSDLIKAAAAKLADRQPQNPFYQYLANGPTDLAKQLVLAQCPVTKANVPADRAQWSWERADSDEAWRKSMVWDCVFMGTLLLKPGA